MKWRGWFRRQEEYLVLLETLARIEWKLEALMSSEQDLQNSLDAIKDGVGQVVAKLTGQSQTIADLQAQIAAGTPVSQAQLDSLKAEADGIASALSAAVA